MGSLFRQKTGKEPSRAPGKSTHSESKGQTSELREPWRRSSVARSARQEKHHGGQYRGAGDATQDRCVRPPLSDFVRVAHCELGLLLGRPPGIGGGDHDVRRGGVHASDQPADGAEKDAQAEAAHEVAAGAIPGGRPRCCSVRARSPALRGASRAEPQARRRFVFHFDSHRRCISFSTPGLDSLATWLLDAVHSVDLEGPWPALRHCDGWCEYRKNQPQ